MTLTEALKAGALRLRQPGWNEYAHIELVPVGGGYYGPWVTLRDVAGRPEGGEQQVLVFEIAKGGWEAWEAPDDVERFFPCWPTYESAEKGEKKS